MAIPLWDETLNGDLSGNRLEPTPFGLNEGSNALSGVTVVGDLAYFSIASRPAQR